MTSHELRETTESLYRRGSTDGLPVVPPSEERVEEVLRGTDLPRDHEIGRLGNREGSLTVEKLAINAVMAGCTPIHLPVLVAGARAMTHPESNVIQVSVSTGSWAYLWLLNGPIREAIGIDHRFGAGRANRLIGRALGLAYKNTALIHPGEKDMGVQGNPFKFSLFVGENEASSPWEPLHQTAGFDDADSTITLGGPNGFGQYRTPPDSDATDVLERLIYATPPWINGKERESYRSWVIHALSPGDAATLHDAGLSKRDVKEYLCETDAITGAARYSGFIARNEDESVEPFRIPTYEAPELIKLPVIGTGAGENVVIGPSLGGPVTEPIELPDGWEDLLAEYGSNGVADPSGTFALDSVRPT